MFPVWGEGSWFLACVLEVTSPGLTSTGHPLLLRSVTSQVATQAPMTPEAFLLTLTSNACENWPHRVSSLLCIKHEKASVTTSESFKSLILQNYSQKIISARWFVVQLGFIAWFIEYSAVWHICSLPNRRDDASLWSSLPTLNQWQLLKLIYHGPGWFASEIFMLETGRKKSP